VSNKYSIQARTVRTLNKTHMATANTYLHDGWDTGFCLWTRQLFKEKPTKTKQKQI